MKVEEIMTKQLVVIDVNQSLRDARRLMEKRDIARLLVKDKNKIVGIITERDVANRLGNWKERKISDAHIYVSTIYSYDLIKINKDQSLSTAAGMMLEHDISSIAVSDNGNIIGLVTKTDIIKALSGSAERVRDHMTRPVFTLPAGSGLLEARRAMMDKGIKRIPILLNERVAGMVTERDIANNLGLFRKVLEGSQWDEKLKKISVESVMSKKVVSVSDMDAIGDCVGIMLKNKISGIPVVRDEKLLGIITKTDLVKMVRDSEL